MRKAIQEQIRGMSPPDAIEYLMCFIETLIPPKDEDAISEAVNCGLTPNQAKILLFIFNTKLATRRAIYDALYFSRSADDLPDEMTVNVHVYNLRKVMCKKRWQARIDTLWGVGYVGVREDGFLFPWEQT